MRAIALIGHGSRKPEGNTGVHALALRLPGVVTVGFIELAEPTADAALDAAVATGADEVVALPAVLLAAGHAKNDVPLAVVRARARHPGVLFRAARPMGVHPAMLRALADRFAAVAPSEDAGRTAVLLVGRGSSDPDANADLYKIGRLFAERRGLCAVDVAFVGVTTPTVAEGLHTLLLRQPRAVVVLPYLLFPGEIEDRLRATVAEVAALHRGVRFALAESVGEHPAVVEVLLDRRDEAVTGTGGMSCDACKYRVPLHGFGAEVGGAQALREASVHAELPADTASHILGSDDG